MFVIMSLELFDELLLRRISVVGSLVSGLLIRRILCGYRISRTDCGQQGEPKKLLHVQSPHVSLRRFRSLCSAVSLPLATGFIQVAKRAVVSNPEV